MAGVLHEQLILATEQGIAEVEVVIMQAFLNQLVYAIFRHRITVVTFFALATVFLGFKATKFSSTLRSIKIFLLIMTT